MPIIIYKDIAFVASRSEFLTEYKKIETEEKSILEKIMKGFDFDKSVLAITELYKRKEDEQKNDGNKRKFFFNYKDKDAQEITMELLVLFSKFYIPFKIIDSNNSLQPISEYLLPRAKFYFIEDSNITISIGDLYYNFFISQIRQVRGIINNFIIVFDHHIIHFCSELIDGKFIKIVPASYTANKEVYYRLNDFDYIYDRNRPSKYKLWKYRRKGFLVILQ